MYLLPCELHAAVTRPTLERVVGLYGARGTVAIIGKTIRGDVETRDQRFFHCTISFSTGSDSGLMVSLLKSK